MTVAPQTDSAAATAQTGFVILAFAEVDLERRARQGFPEVSFGQGTFNRCVLHGSISPIRHPMIVVTSPTHHDNR